MYNNNIMSSSSDCLVLCVEEIDTDYDNFSDYQKKSRVYVLFDVTYGVFLIRLYFVFIYEYVSNVIEFAYKNNCLILVSDIPKVFLFIYFKEFFLKNSV